MSIDKMFIVAPGTTQLFTSSFRACIGANEHILHGEFTKYILQYSTGMENE